MSQKDVDPILKHTDSGSTQESVSSGQRVYENHGFQVTVHLLSIDKGQKKRKVEEVAPISSHLPKQRKVQEDTPVSSHVSNFECLPTQYDSTHPLLLQLMSSLEEVAEEQVKEAMKGYWTSNDDDSSGSSDTEEGDRSSS